MKAKTIRKVLRAKIDEWAASIEDTELRKLVLRDALVTGGCIASMLLKEPVNDYDVYFTNKMTALRVAKYYVDRFHIKNKAGGRVPIFVEEKGDRIRIIVKSAGIASEEGTEIPYDYFEGRPDAEAARYVSAILDNPEDIEDAYEQTSEDALNSADEGPKYRPVFLSTNAITLSHRIQVCIRFFGEPDQIHENYDFAHCTSYWLSRSGELTLRPAALEAILTRELRYVGSKYPIASLIRVRKFVQRGWSINAGQILKMIMQTTELDLKNVSVLEDQLTGVDAAYFVQLVDKLREKDPEKVNSAYLVEIIDRMF